MQRLIALKKLGFEEAHYYSALVNIVQDVERLLQRWLTSSLPFVTDGVVVCTSAKPAGKGCLPDQSD